MLESTLILVKFTVEVEIFLDLFLCMGLDAALYFLSFVLVEATLDLIVIAVLEYALI